MKDCPEVYIHIRKQALSYHKKGEKRIGMRHLIEVSRYKLNKSTGSLIKINNNFAPVLARLLILEKPFLEEVIETRQSDFAQEFTKVELLNTIPKAVKIVDRPKIGDQQMIFDFNI